MGQITKPAFVGFWLETRLYHRIQMRNNPRLFRLSKKILKGRKSYVSRYNKKSFLFYTERNNSLPRLLWACWWCSSLDVHTAGYWVFHHSCIRLGKWLKRDKIIRKRAGHNSTKILNINFWKQFSIVTSLITKSLPAIMTVLEFPPRLSLRRNVSTESRYGTNSFFLNDGRFDGEEALMEFSAIKKGKNIRF